MVQAQVDELVAGHPAGLELGPDGGDIEHDGLAVLVLVEIHRGARACSCGR